MTEQNTIANPSDDTQTTITPEQYQALQAEVERLRKHSETLLAEKKAESEQRKAEQAEKDRLAEETARKKGFLSDLCGREDTLYWGKGSKYFSKRPVRS